MAFWLGSQLFLFLVVRPALRRHLDRPQQTQLTAALGRRFSPLGWGALLLAILTGLLTAERRGVQWLALLQGSSAYAHFLLIKMLLVGLVVLLTLLHGRLIGPQLSALASLPDPATRARYQRLRRLSVTVSSLNLLFTLIIVLLSARLVA